MKLLEFEKNDAPCVANSALKRAGTDKKDIIHPQVVTSIDQDFYMDDLLRIMIQTKTFVSNTQETLNQLPEIEILNRKDTYLEFL